MNLVDEQGRQYYEDSQGARSFMMRSGQNPHLGAVWIAEMHVPEMLDHGWTFEPRPEKANE